MLKENKAHDAGWTKNLQKSEVSAVHEKNFDFKQGEVCIILFFLGLGKIFPFIVILLCHSFLINSYVSFDPFLRKNDPELIEIFQFPTI